MRFAIVSDVHANLQAWNAVLSDIAVQSADRIVCLGDLLGYGADPAAVLESAYRHVDAFVLGNHDAVIAGSLSADWFTADAQTALNWTLKALRPRAREVLSRFPLCLTGPGFRCAHGDFARPGAFDYINDPADALPSWQQVDEPLLFVGHTHQPGIFLLGASGVPHRVEPEDFVLEPGKRYLVNVGSVGVPRGGDALATYCLYDADAATLRWRRVPFDLDACRAALRQAGLPMAPFQGLSQDPRDRLRQVREVASFSPPQAPADHAQPSVDTRDMLQPLLRRTRRWRRMALAGLGLLALSAVGGGLAAWRRATAGDALPSGPLPPIERLFSPGSPNLNLLTDWRWASRPNPRLPGWRVIRDAARHQRWRLADEPEYGTLLVLSSTTAGERFRIEAPPITLPSDDIRLQARARFRKSDSFRGHIGLVFDIEKEPPEGGVEPVPAYQRREPRMPRQGGWIKAQITLDFPRHTRQVQLAIEGYFEGEVEILSVVLQPVE